MADVERKPEAATPAERDWFGDWVSRWFEDWPLPRFAPGFWRAGLMEGLHPIRVEEFREGDTSVVRAELPGVDPERDIEIDVTDGTLRIRAERRQETKVEERGGYRSEFRYGSFSRTVPLPAGATEQDVTASYKDGILEVRIAVPKERAAARKVPVQRG